jgi:hypothetical protein
MKPIHKFNNSDGATLCNRCSKIIATGFTDDLYCSQEYKLVREDGLTKQSKDVCWLEFDENGKFKAKHKDIAVGRSLLMSPFSQFFTWQTTDIKEIIEQREDYIKFKTTNSIYELYEKADICR